MAIFSNKRNIQKAKTAAKQIKTSGLRSVELTAAQSASQQAAERAKANVSGMLGAPGTYGPGSDTSGSDFSDVFDTSGLGLSQPDQTLSGGTKKFKKGILGKAREGILDPEKFGEAVRGTSLGRQWSMRVAESEQLLNREGPMWDELNQATHGIISSDAALALRDTMRQLKNDQAKGGSVRNASRNQAMQIAAKINVMRNRADSTWRANLQLFSQIRANADAVSQGSTQWVNSLPLVNEAHQLAMRNAVRMQTAANEVLAANTLNAYKVAESQQPVNFGESLLEGVITMAASYVSPILGAGLAAGADYLKSKVAGPKQTGEQSNEGVDWSGALT